MYFNWILQILLISIINIQNTFGRDSKISPQLKYGSENNNIFKKSSDIIDIDLEKSKQIDSKFFLKNQIDLTKNEKYNLISNNSSIILTQNEHLNNNLKNDSIDYIKINNYEEFKDKNENIDDITTDIIELKNSNILNSNIKTELPIKNYNQTIFEDNLETSSNNNRENIDNVKFRKIENQNFKTALDNIETANISNKLNLRQNIDGTISLGNNNTNDEKNKNLNLNSNITLENSTNNILLNSTDNVLVNSTNNILLNSTDNVLVNSADNILLNSTSSINDVDTSTKNESSLETNLFQNTTQPVISNSTDVNMKDIQNSTMSTTVSSIETNLNITDPLSSNNNVTESSEIDPPTQSPPHFFQNCYLSNKVSFKNCTDCIRCPNILNNNSTGSLIPKKIRLMFSNKDFDVYKFLSLEILLRSTLEKEIKESFNLTTCNIVYNYPFPIITPELFIISFLVTNLNFKDKVEAINEIDIKDHLINGDEIKKLLENKLSKIENLIQMKLECIKYESDNSLTCIGRPPDVKQKIYFLLICFIAIILVTVVILLIIIFVKRSRSKFKSTRLKLFNDSNLDPHFYDLNDGRSSLNAIRLQNLNRISANEYIYQSPYQQNDGIDLVNEIDILREENNQDENFLKPNSNINGTNSISKKIKKKALNINEKKVYYNPKYERNSQYLNDNQFNQITINVDKVNNFDLNQNQTNCSDCGFKFVNCDCLKNNSNDITITPVEVKNKPPSGKKKTLGQVNVNYDFSDTKL